MQTTNFRLKETHPDNIDYYDKKMVIHSLLGIYIYSNML